MEVKRNRALRGPNLWVRSAALEADVKLLGGERSVRGFKGFEDRLSARFAGLGP